ncbi:MAG: hypothetical protein CM15mP103_03240 [Gammaproteobacteria bacterium]|nr:MAG: hypothetical protein CM15mP103_03240 [Gammaproteobacteria bacterium]
MTGLGTDECASAAGTQAAHLFLATIFATVSIWGVEANAASHTTWRRHGFAMGLIIWAWLELSYLMGYITGREAPATASMTLPQRFYNALGTTIYHEFLVVVWWASSAFGRRAPQSDHSEHPCGAVADALEYQAQPVLWRQAFQ